MGGDVACCCGFGAGVMRVEGGEDGAGCGLVGWVCRVEEGEAGRVEERRGGFGFVTPVGGCFREGGFDLGFPALGAVEGDLEGY